MVVGVVFLSAIVWRVEPHISKQTWRMRSQRLRSAAYHLRNKDNPGCRFFPVVNKLTRSIYRVHNRFFRFVLYKRFILQHITMVVSETKSRHSVAISALIGNVLEKCQLWDDTGPSRELALLGL